jgi:Zn-dependent protease with chaperone function
LVALTAVATLIILYVMSETVQSARRRELCLAALSEPSTTATKQSFVHYRLIDSEHLAVWCAGLIFPKIYVSSGLVKQLTKLQLHAVLAHEYGHVLRRDNLRKLLLNWSSAFWLPKLKQCLRLRFAAQMEQQADRDSANITGNTELIAEIYTMFGALSQTSVSLYQHRHVNEEHAKVVDTPSLVATFSAYVSLAAMLTVFTIFLTVATHALLEHIAS